MSLRARGALLLSTPFFFFNDTATTEIYTLSLHDALPISLGTGDGPPVDSDEWASRQAGRGCWPAHLMVVVDRANAAARSEEHTSELQSLTNLVCRHLLEEKKSEQNGNICHGDRKIPLAEQ